MTVVLKQCRMCGCALTLINTSKQNATVFKNQCKPCSNKVLRAYRHRVKSKENKSYFNKIKSFLLNVLKKIRSK